MNILVVGKFEAEGFALHIAETLARMGHAVRRYDPGPETGPVGGLIGHRLGQVKRLLKAPGDALPSVRAWRIRALWKIADLAPLDLSIVVHDYFWPGEVADLRRRTRAPVAMWFPDPIVNFGKGYFMTAPYDALFFKDPFMVRSMSDVLESPVYYLPECFNPERHWLAEGAIGDCTPYRCDIGTAGNLHSWRVAVFRHLAGRDVKIWGPPQPLWMKSDEVTRMSQGRSVHDHEKVRAFRGAKIVVNNLMYGEMWGVNARCFEAAGAGAFQMLDWRPGLGQLFEDGSELVSYANVADLIRKIEHWLPREAERRRIAEAGMRRAHKEHTYTHRLQVLIDTILGRQGGYPLPDISPYGSGRFK